jgi:multiple sugar transport system permease protein
MSATTIKSKSAPSVAVPKFPEKPLWQKIWRSRTSYLLLLPFFLLFSIFVLYPIFWSAYLSMTEYAGVAARPPEFVGLGNFSSLVSLQLREQPQVVDETTGELMYDCDGEEVIASLVAETEAAIGQRCVPEYGRARDILDRGYRELSSFSFFGTHYILGASDDRFWIALGNTIIYAFSTVPITAIFGLGLALLLRANTLPNLAFRTIFFLPSVTSSIAITVVWRWIFNGESYGFLNAILTRFGLERISFLGEATWSMPILVFISVWGGMGYSMILFLAGLQSISSEYYEAASIDGASPVQSFWGITLPLLRPTMLYIAVTGLIGSFQVFDVMYLLYSTTEHIGGPLDAALTVVPYLYDQGFTTFQLGYASSIAWVLFLLIFVLTVINLRLGRVNEAD